MLIQYAIQNQRAIRNAAPAVLYEAAIAEDNSCIASTGALVTTSGDKTGRSPGDKRIVPEQSTAGDIWWGAINIPLPSPSFSANRRTAIEYFNSARRIYVVDGYAGWDPRFRLKIRVICTRPYHALFMHNMLIRPTPQELEQFGEPDFVIYNAGICQADKGIEGNSSHTSVAIDFHRAEMVILGTEYAGEMKKGVFTIMNYLMPKKGVLSMHCSANEGAENDVTLFFGLSGTGKTTLSADSRRKLIGDDEHCWTDRGVFNIEGGCYAKCLGLSREKEPSIFDAIRFGAVLENVVIDPEHRHVQYDNASLTENTRAAYPLEHIPHVKLPAVGDHPRNVVLLTCDAFGVLPPVSKLTPEQAMYHFLSGYTAKVAGTEQGVKEPQVTFSACFGAAFLVWPPSVYAEMLASKMQQHVADAWLVNTGWSGGPYGKGKRIALEHTRAIIDAIHRGELASVDTETESFFGLRIPKSCSGCPSGILQPRTTWSDPQRYDATAKQLVQLFEEHRSAHVIVNATSAMMEAARV